MNATVVKSGEAPIRGGAASTARSPNPAIDCELARMAITAAAIAAAIEPARPTSTGIRPYSRVAAIRASEMVPNPIATRT